MSTWTITKPQPLTLLNKWTLTTYYKSLKGGSASDYPRPSFDLHSPFKTCALPFPATVKAGEEISRSIRSVRRIPGYVCLARPFFPFSFVVVRSRQIGRDRNRLACPGSIPWFRGLVNMGTAHTSYLVAGSPRITHRFSLKFLLFRISVIEVMKASVMVLCHLTILVFVSPCFSSTFI